MLSEQGNLVREAFPLTHPPPAHSPASALPIPPRERTTNTFSATTSSSRSRAPAPARPPASAFQEMATSQRGPKNQCVSVEKQLEEGVPGQHHLTTSQVWSIAPLDHPVPGRWAGLHPGQVGGASGMVGG